MAVETNQRSGSIICRSVHEGTRENIVCLVAGNFFTPLSIIHPTPPSTPHSLSSCPGGGYGVRPRYPSRTLPEPAVTRLPPSGASPRVIRGRRLFRRRRRGRGGGKKRASRRNSPSRMTRCSGLFLVGCRRPPPPPPIPPGSQEGGNYLLGGEWMDTDTRFFRPRSPPAVSPPIAA